ncbi:hypothetical protein [Collinsella sp. AF28-5AC]|uniref:hypothetical protein n=1 Tax=Collinsella sp. AF28-5AC TaxID=2292227 RepID=UPI000E4D576B|nr:hypothetical protein [Collinsella sp. AF28-5AC]RGQ33807.1 hypothetical protein DWZ01_03295 [Collinsella sp. AF28-5AC]
MSACSICMRQKSRCADGVQPKFVIVEAENLSPDERTAFTLLSSRVATALLPDPAQGDLAAQCQAFGCTLDQAAVIATSQRGLPLLLEAGIALALRGAGYENEAAADMVFQPRSSGGLAAAIEYACRLVA